MSRSRLTVCVDSNIAGWMIRDPLLDRAPSKPTNYAESRKRAEWLLNMLVKSNCLMVMPTIVIAELLVPCSEDERAGFLSLVKEYFIVADFDARAADQAAGYLGDFSRGLSGETGVARKTIRADVLIAASAKVKGCSVLFSEDKAMRAIASKMGMEAKGLPTDSDDIFESAGLPRASPTVSLSGQSTRRPRSTRAKRRS